MSIGILGRRYASALITLAEQAGNLSKIASDLHDFAATWQSSPELRTLFENPKVGVATRREILRDLAQASGMDPLLRNTLLLLSDRGRIRELGQIVEAFDSLAEVRSGRVRAEVVTASELPDAFFAELQKTLELVTGKQVVIAKSVDPSLLGGVVTRIGDQVFDGSVSHRLSELKHELSR
jgi:F-type H+-transporting ATPase subunit delta